MPLRLLAAALALLLLTSPALAQSTRPAGPMSLDPATLRPPKTYPADDFKSDGVTAVFFDGLPYKGNPTRAFAWYGLPKVEPGKKVPAMVLVHGGGGTAFADWVRLWTSRGYAAIAMDTCGQVPKGTYDKWERHPLGGPAGWGGLAKEQVDLPPTDQWTYHAISDVVLAHSLIRSFPEVDADRVGITGISWGGYLTCIAAGLDDRFKLAVPVYGCGYLGDNSTWLSAFEKMGPDHAGRWLAMWDPSRYLPAAKVPMLWVTGTNDFAYPMDSLRKSYRAAPGERTLCVTIRMPHGHNGPGEKPPEIQAFADAVLRDGVPLAKVGKLQTTGKEVSVRFESKSPIAKAELIYTTAGTGPWQKREWKSSPATVDKAANTARATLPEGSAVYYVNLIDERGMTVSTEHVEAGEK